MRQKKNKSHIERMRTNARRRNKHFKTWNRRWKENRMCTRYWKVKKKTPLQNHKHTHSHSHRIKSKRDGSIFKCFVPKIFTFKLIVYKEELFVVNRDKKKSHTRGEGKENKNHFIYHQNETHRTHTHSSR